jgi:GT2 family glycosyltransferase
MTGSPFEVVVVTYQSAPYIRPCLRSLRKTGGIVVVDNDSRDQTREIIAKEFPEVRLISARKNLGYARALNLGIAQTSSPIVVAANADTVFPAGSLERLASFLGEHPRAGVAGPQQVFPDGSWQRSYGTVHGLCEAVKALVGVTSIGQIARRLSWRRIPGRSRAVGYVDGAVMVIRRAAFDQVGGFDEAFSYYAEDADFCLRLRQAAWEVIHVPGTDVIHIRGGSSTRVEGYSDKFLRAQAHAKCLLIRKHRPGWHLWLYRRISVLHAWKMCLLYRILRMVCPRRYTSRASLMASAFRRWAALLNSVQI